MGKLKYKVKIKWSPQFAYAIGLITTDGNLSPDGRHINFTSKDREQILTFKRCLKIDNKVGRKARASEKFKKYYVIQFGDRNFYQFLLAIGLTPRKSRTIGALMIPKKYFLDFLRGHFDGDGTFYSYWDKRWRSSFMFYIEFVSGSEKHVIWLRKKINSMLGINGHVTKARTKGSVWQLKYAKTESLILLQVLYKKKNAPRLSRKYLKIKRVLAIVNKQSLI